MRENVLAIRLDDDEWNRISDMAGSVSLPMSSYVRSFVLTQKPPKPKATGVTVEAVAALNRIGALLNQIARVGNSSKSIPAAEVMRVTAARERILEIATKLTGD
ncbi:plasmid mobilization protein [Roseovarius sp. MS2]|uniref:plasmid mobilization protein n=1 Tax=Roseovarius sp. MS2 TaxID=3390728 RepID=UPI003EDC5E98